MFYIFYNDSIYAGLLPEGQKEIDPLPQKRITKMSRFSILLWLSTSNMIFLSIHQNNKKAKQSSSSPLSKKRYGLFTSSYMSSNITYSNSIAKKDKNTAKSSPPQQETLAKE